MLYKKDLSKEDQLKLIDEAKSGNKKSKEEIVLFTVNYFLKTMYLKSFRQMNKGDFIGEAYLKILDLLNTFNRSKSDNFIGYCKIGLFRHISSLKIKLSKIVKRTSHVDSIVRSINNLKSTNLNEEEIKKKLNIEDIEKYLNLQKIECNIDDIYFHKNLINNNDNFIENVDIKNKINNCLNFLNDKEKYVIEQYYFEEKDIKEIAIGLSCSAENARQTHLTALRKLRLTPKLNELKEYVE
jgi:RNA polymerase sigma factor FliA